MRRAGILLLSLQIALAGCGDRKAALVGKWQFSIESSKQYSVQGGLSTADEAEKAMLGAIEALLNSWELELMKNGQVTAKFMGYEQTGKWSLEGDAITITTYPPIRGKVDPSNKSIRVDEFAGTVQPSDGTTLILRKKDVP